MQKGDKSLFQNPKIVYVAILALSFVFYGNTLKNGYSLDDNLITSTPDSKHPSIEGGFSAIPKIFTSHFVVNQKQSYAYRPVATTSFAIEYQFFGSNPSVSHLFNILLYALIIMVLFKTLNNLLGEEKYLLTALTCFIFLIHPIHTEVVNNLKCRDELLSTLFGLLSLFFALRYFDYKKIINVLWMFSFILLGLLSKKTALIFIAITPLSLYFFRTFNLKKVGLIMSVAVLGFFIMKGMNKLLLQETVSRVKQYFENPLYYSGYAERIPMFFYSNFYYFSLMLFPHPLRYYYGYNQVPMAEWSNIWVIISVIAFIGLGYLILKRIKKKELWLFGLLFYLLGIGGACNLLFPAVGIIAERFAFIASIGFSVFMAGMIHFYFLKKEAKFESKKSLSYGFIVILGIIAFPYIFNRNTHWESEMSLYEHDIKHLEHSFKAHSLLGQNYYKQASNMLQSGQPYNSYKNLLKQSITHLHHCNSIYDQYSVNYNNLGALQYSFYGNIDSAEIYFSKAIELDSIYIEAIYNLGNIHLWKFKSNIALLQAANSIASDFQSTTANPISLEEITKLNSLGNIFLRFSNQSPKIIIEASNGAKIQKDFLDNLEKLVSNKIISLGLLDYFDTEVLHNILTSNAKEIMQSYNQGDLNTHLTNFVNGNLIQNYYNANFLHISKTQIMDFANSNANSYSSKLEEGMKNCLEISPSYYPPYKGLSEFYELKNRTDDLISLNKKALEIKDFKYYHEFEERIAKAYFKIGDKISSFNHYQNTLSELDRNIDDINIIINSNKPLTPEQSNILPQLKTLRTKTLSNLINLSSKLNKKEQLIQYQNLINSPI